MREDYIDALTYSEEYMQYKLMMLDRQDKLLKQLGAQKHDEYEDKFNVDEIFGETHTKPEPNKSDITLYSLKKIKEIKNTIKEESSINIKEKLERSVFLCDKKTLDFLKGTYQLDIKKIKYDPNNKGRRYIYIYGMELTFQISNHVPCGLVQIVDLTELENNEKEILGGIK